MLPPHLVDAFWEEVAAELKKRRVPADGVRTSIGEYRDALASHDADEWACHREPHEIAEAIAAGLARKTAPRRRIASRGPRR